MNRSIRKTAAILAHVGLLLAIVFLVFFIVCSLHAQKADASSDQKDLYLKQAMNEHDFSVYTVGKALSEENDPVRETVFVSVDLIVPMLCLASGVLLQLAMVRPRRKAQKEQPSQSTTIRR